MKKRPINLDSLQSIRSYLPLIGVFGIVLLFTIAKTLFTPHHERSLVHSMDAFMGFFFLFFSLSKLININGFVRAFKRYDLLARKISAYAYTYPFIELALAIAYLSGVFLVWTNLVTVMISAIGIIGIYTALQRKEKLVCACLGSVLNVPLSKVAIFENALMLCMATTMLFLLLP
jgi:hypothetical protein